MRDNPARQQLWQPRLLIRGDAGPTALAKKVDQWPSLGEQRPQPQEKLISSAQIGVHNMESSNAGLGDHPFLRSLPSSYLRIMAECAEPREYSAGSVIFREGDIADRFFLIQCGKVSLEAHVPPRGELAVQNLGADDVLGWSWLFPPFVWHFQARAIEPTRVVSFNGAHLLIACERNHEFGYDLMKRLAQVLIRRLQATQGHLIKLHAGRASGELR
jgi:hypothetical protein